MENVNELLLAAHVRQIAENMREADADEAQAQAQQNNQIFGRSQWKARNPLAGYVPKALAELVEVADIISPGRHKAA